MYIDGFHLSVYSKVRKMAYYRRYRRYYRPRRRYVYRRRRY